MANAVKLKHLNIGDIDGKKESSINNFEQLFYTKNSMFQYIMENDNFIISGRKGTGKTILANYIANSISSKTSICKVYDKNSFSLQKLIDLEYENLQEEEISIFWRWFFLIKLSEQILKLNPYKKFVPFTYVKKLNKFLKQRYTSDIFKLDELTTSTAKKSIVSGSYKSTNQSLNGSREESKGNTKKFSNKKYYELIGQLEELISKNLDINQRITLIFDDLDELENPFNNEKNYFKMFKSMLETAQEINLKLNHKLKNNSKIIILIRSDILDEIHKHSSNSNKLSSSEVNLYWISKNQKSPHNQPLMSMIIYKIQKSVPSYTHLSEKEIYYTIFPKKINHKEVIDYLLDYSFGRPRDIVQYLSLIKKKFPETKSIKAYHFKECAKDYSKWFYSELLNEISINPKKDSLLSGIELIRSLKKIHFSFEEISDFYKQNIDDYQNITNLKEVLISLYKYGLIGNSYPHENLNTGVRKLHFAWGYRNDSKENPDFSKTFVLHNGFKNHFS